MTSFSPETDEKNSQKNPMMKLLSILIPWTPAILWRSPGIFKRLFLYLINPTLLLPTYSKHTKKTAPCFFTFNPIKILVNHWDDTQKRILRFNHEKIRFNDPFDSTLITDISHRFPIFVCRCLLYYFFFSRFSQTFFFMPRPRWQIISYS